MGHIAAALGQGSQFTFRNKEYTLAPWTFGIQASFERFLEDKAVRAAKRMQALLSKQEYDDLMSRVVRDIASGVYTFGSEVVQQSLQSVDNIQYMTFLQLRENHPEVKLDLVKEMFKEEMDLVMQKMNEANAEDGEAGESENPPADGPSGKSP